MLETKIILENIGMNGKAIGSLLLGIVSTFGIFLVGYGGILSIAGLLLGLFALTEIKKFKLKGRISAVIGVILNCIGIISLLY
ncbi:DUF4190 domain-containing protein [Niallia sp. XMNu-256]|uniref:DUF4190 domain-containing protein n=1 Tax=Niallia sp. XMNu-256 TaxID=3082444 RepID=UPI0030D17FB1